MATRKQTAKVKKSSSQKRAGTKSGGGKASGKVVSAYGNTWEDVVPGAATDVKAVEAKLGVSLPATLSSF